MSGLWRTYLIKTSTTISIIIIGTSRPEINPDPLANFSIMVAKLLIFLKNNPPLHFS
jgi:hypothetical protein